MATGGSELSQMSCEDFREFKVIKVLLLCLGINKAVRRRNISYDSGTLPQIITIN